MIRSDAFLMAAVLVMVTVPLQAQQPADAASAEAPAEYEIGGPLAGLKLPGFPGQHGEPAGYPGSLPDPPAAAPEADYTPQDQNPQMDLYPGSVEHWRANWMKHVPSRSFFDRQSLLKNFVAPDIAGAEGHVEPFAAPLYWQPRFGMAVNTTLKMEPVPVVRMKVDAPVLKLDLGELGAGLYAVRVIGLVETQHMRRFREPLYLTMRINDRADGSVSRYRIRIGYVDEFYSVAELYFNAPEARHYKAELFVDDGSTVDLLVHNITLDDVLAGAERRAIKTRRTLTLREATEPAMALDDVPQAAREMGALTDEQRRARDEAIWKALPPINAQGNWINLRGPTVMSFFNEGTPAMSREQIEQEYGKWEPTPHGMGTTSAYFFHNDLEKQNILLRNEKLDLVYTMDDLIAGRSLPDPYPFKDDGAGLYFPDPDDEAEGLIFAPIADEVGRRIGYYRATLIEASTEFYKATGNEEFLHDAALALVRYAYLFPTYDVANFITPIARAPGEYDRDMRSRQREEISRWMDYGDPYGYVKQLRDYDRLFDYIQGNQALADRVHRFIPSVETPEDVIELLDVYLVQTLAKRIMRYHYFTYPTAIADTAAMLAEPSLTDPWMQWLFTKTYKYPLRPLGIQDMLINGYGRDGAELRGSSFYAHVGGHSSAAVAADMDAYLEAGGNPQFSVRDPQRFPKPLAQTHWELDMVIAGAENPRVGDVTGPEKSLGLPRATAGIERASRLGWRWSRDPKFAWLLHHYFGRAIETDEEWAGVEEAAAQVARAPWLDNRSRVLPNWAGILETGQQHDDFRFRRAAYVRLGMGYGHHHHDTLDLHVIAHGLPMTIDAGQRPGYSTPPDRTSRVHNVVEIDGQDHRSHSWVRALSDVAGVQYLDAQAAPPTNATLFRRQIALVDIHEGEGSQPLSIEQQRPGSELPKGITSAGSYVFDVFRVEGGELHTYAFHSTTEDEFTWNASDVQPVPHIEEADGQNAEADYLSIFKVSADTKFAGNAPATFHATWRYPQEGIGSERFMLGANHDPESPRKYMRLHLLGLNDARALRADMVSTKWSYRFTNLMVQQPATDEAGQGSAFVALLEPYVGEPEIIEQQLLEVQDNERDALRAVAVQVQTRNGHTDVLFADGRPEKTRRVGELQIAGEFALYATDDEGLRLATLTGGTQLSGPDVRLQLAARQRTATVTAADYATRTLTLDGPWSQAAAGRLLEIGSPEQTTAYTSVAVAPGEDGARVTLQRGADYFRSPIESVNAEQNVVLAVHDMPIQVPGRERNWAATNEDQTRFWRVDYLGDRRFQVRGEAVGESDFGPDGVLRLWEYDPGDQVRQSTFAGLHRVQPGVYELTADVDTAVSLRGSAMELSSDAGQTWAPATTTAAEGWVTLSLPADQLQSPVQLRVRP